MAEIDPKPIDPVDPVDPKPVDELAEYRNEDGTFSEDKIKKLAEDKKYFRQQISKLKQMPEKIEDYGKDFVLDSKFNEFAAKEENQEKIKNLFEKIDKLSMEKGIGIERNHDIRRFVMDELVEAKAIDLTTDAEKAAANQKVIDERNEKVKEVIGDVTDINAWNNALCDWLKGFCNSEAEFQMHKSLLERNSIWALSLNKVRHAMMGNKIPVAVSEPKYNEEEWMRAFHKADKETQDKMMQERAEMLIKNRK
ncbi:MAG: hypothetical protein J6S67_23350 [Methanobrevibacter sp.]|nr:hypothetical protein [Methanobrevibacter sp.]